MVMAIKYAVAVKNWPNLWNTRMEIYIHGLDSYGTLVLDDFYLVWDVQLLVGHHTIRLFVIFEYLKNGCL
jgi:hypothetical protein